ncbi:MAG: oligopeptide/dipeptide ABC transporter ATP-binding protein, partial [Acetobacteraceae bacterium]
LKTVTVAFGMRGVGRRAPLRAVDRVSLEVARGEIVGIVGESGSGKSTLARLIVGLLAPAEGEIIFGGAALSSARRPAGLRRRIQMVFQDPFSSLDPRMSVGQQLAEILRVHAIVPRRRTEEACRALLVQVHLPPELMDARPRQMSGGQRQRVAIARSLAVRPELLVADEPVSALDVSVQAGIIHLFAELRSTLGLTLLFIAHDLAVVRHLCDRIAVMYMGRIVESGATEAIFRAPRHPYTRALLTAIPRLRPTEAAREASPIGEPPSFIRPPCGCRFRSRCPLAFGLCEHTEPELVAFPDSGHAAACHLAAAETVLSAVTSRAGQSS